jgi:hypothetical protein
MVGDGSTAIPLGTISQVPALSRRADLIPQAVLGSSLRQNESSSEETL